MWMRETENMSTYSSWTGSIVCRASDTSSPATILGSLLLLPVVLQKVPSEGS